MASTTLPSLHRLVSSGQRDTSEYGYEVLVEPTTVDGAISVLAWIDCWCPDAAQFVLLDAPADLTPTSCMRLSSAVSASQFAQKLRLVCKGPMFSDQAVLASLLEQGIGLLLGDVVDSSLARISSQGIVGIRLHPALVDRFATCPKANAAVYDVVNTARDLGLRSVASQVARHTDHRKLLASGLDYLSPLGQGVAPLPMTSWYNREVDG